MPEQSLFPAAADAPVSGYARVAVERALDDPEGLTYAIPNSWRDLRVGERVLVPLGRGNKPAAGCIVTIGVAPDLDPARIKPMRSRTGVRLPASLVELARWMARYYCCPLGVAIAAMAPAAVKKGVGVVSRLELEPTGAEPLSKLPPATARAWEAIRALPDDTFPLPARDLADRVGARTIGPINRLVEIGALREVSRRRVRAVWEEPTAAFAALAEAPAPTDEQRAAVEAIADSLGGFHQHLLFGVTASGKTEVYLRVIERVIAQGECALALVPEISLTPQTVARFRARFEEAGVAVLHSGLTAAQRNQQWSAVASGAARIAVGARSAVFAPFDAAAGSRLGVIVVDEEHDSAYKQDEAPRFSARDVAIRRAQIEGCPVVLGSATPSLESWRNAVLKRSSLHRLKLRAPGMRFPTVRIVDMALERRALAQAGERGMRLIGPTLERALRRTLGADAQAMFLLNRRGYANYISCPDHVCGWVFVCDDCDAAMVLHRSRDLPAGGALRCHHCQAEQRVPALCPVCGRRVATFGAGTQRAEEELSRLFPELIEGETMLRLDSDAVRSASQWREALSRFERREVRVLLGTQMIGKGLDFPDVRLVGVVSADTAIALPDFRAAERTFQLVAQVAGRAGRADGESLVVVQTMNPHEPAIALAAAGRCEEFAERELALRADADLPPISRMARVVVRHVQYDKAFALSRRIAEGLAAAMAQSRRDERLRVRGPFPCPISRIAGRHRVAIELTAATPAALQRVLTSLRNAGLLVSDATTAVDVDPMTLL